MRRKNFIGLYTALITPFLNDKIDEKGLIENIEFQIQNQVDGLVVLGTTGETPTLYSDECKQIIKIARCHTSIDLIVGTGTYSTQETIENSLIAQDLGADALLIVTPYYNKPTQAGLVAHYEAIANKVSLPIILYNNFVRTSINMEVSTIEHLAKLPNIIGIKECCANLHQFAEMVLKIKSIRPDFSIFTGDDINTFSTLLLGADGVISTIANLIPDRMRNLVDALIANDLLLARQLHYELFPLFNAISLETNPIPIKAAMNALGMAAGSCRLPLAPMQQKNLDQLFDILERYQIYAYAKGLPHEN